MYDIFLQLCFSPYNVVLPHTACHPFLFLYDGSTKMGATGSTYSTSIFEESRNQLNSREVGNVVLQGPLLKRSETVSYSIF